MTKIQVLKHLPEAKELSGEERLQGERWRRVRGVGVIKEKRSEEMTQSNISSPWGSKVSLESRGVMAVEVPQNEKISGGKTEGIIGSASVKEEQIGRA